MRIVCLLENTSCDERLGAEHGLSLYIETTHRRLLFDMGQSSLFADNAAKLSVSLSQADTAIVSHGHYDHGGGLDTFLSVNNTAPVYIHRYAFEPHMHGEKYIGLDTALQKHPRLKFTDGCVPLGDGLTLYADALTVGGNDFDSGGLSVMRNNQCIPDDFRHEQYLLIEENGKRVLISGCSHRGILALTSRFHPNIVIGGFHISKLDPALAVTRYAAALNAFSTDFYTCHCTGVAQYEALADVVPRLHYLSGGQVLTL